jgi:hypothetical protein
MSLQILLIFLDFTLVSHIKVSSLLSASFGGGGGGKTHSKSLFAQKARFDKWVIADGWTQTSSITSNVARPKVSGNSKILHKTIIKLIQFGIQQVIIWFYPEYIAY